jgi:hypothetical protein
MARSDTVLGPLFTVGAALLGLGLVRRSLPLAVAGIVAMVADQRLPAAQRLNNALKPE